MGATELALCVMDLDGHRGMSLHCLLCLLCLLWLVAFCAFCGSPFTNS